MNSLTYCGKFAKDNDPDRFFLSLLTDQAPDIWPLLAFNAEIAKMREVVTETTIGLIRLQWWRDALEKFYEDGTILQHEIIIDLARVIKKYDLPKEHFENLLYAREFDLEDVLPATLEGMVNYADYTHTPLLELIGLVLDKKEDMRSLAIAYTLTGLLRSVLYHARQHRCYLPQDVLADNQINMATLYDLKAQDGFLSVITTICSVAKRHLDNTSPVTPYTRGMKKMTFLYLKHMLQCGYDPFNKNWITSPRFKELRITWAVKMSRP